MKRGGNRYKQLAEIIEAHPYDQRPAEKLQNFKNTSHYIAWAGFGMTGQGPQAGGTQNSFLMLGNALATKKSFAFRTARSCFAGRVKLTTPVNKGLHVSILPVPPLWAGQQVRSFFSLTLDID